MIYIALVIGAILAYWFYVCIRYYYIFMRGIKGPIPVPLFGNALEFKDTSSLITLSVKYHKKYGDVTKTMLGPFLLISILDLKLLEFFLTGNKHVGKGCSYNFLENWLHTGLLTAKGKKWQQRRKIITPVFHLNILSQFTNIVHMNAEILIKQLETEVDKGSTDIFGYVTLCTLDIICDTAMGTSINAQIMKEDDYLKNIYEIIIHKTMNPFTHFNFFYYLSKHYRKERKCLEVLHDCTTLVITTRRTELENKTIEEYECDEVGIKKRFVFLDFLLQSTIDGKPLSDDDIREEVNTVMFTCHDKITSAISFALFMIAKHPDVQNKILEEQKSLFGDEPNRLYTINDLNKMKYLEAVIEETLRLYPSIPIYFGQTREVLKYSKKINIPAHTLIMIPAFIIHRDPRNFPDPEKFDPERFTDGKTPKPFSYLPFSVGPRNCLGQKFAMLGIKTIISKMLRNYELLPVVPEHKLKLVSETTLKSSNGILISIKRRC